MTIYTTTYTDDFPRVCRGKPFTHRRQMYAMFLESQKSRENFVRVLKDLYWRPSASSGQSQGFQRPKKEIFLTPSRWIRVYTTTHTGDFPRVCREKFFTYRRQMYTMFLPLALKCRGKIDTKIYRENPGGGSTKLLA